MNANAHPIQSIIDQHAEEAAFLWLLRDAAVFAPHYSLKDLAHLDDRVEAHLDGLRIAGEAGWAACAAALEQDEPGEVFVAAVLAFTSGDGKRIDAVASAGSSSAENDLGLISALGWLEYAQIEGIVNHLPSANSPLYRRIAIAVTAIHRRDLGPALATAVEGADLCCSGHEH